MLEKKIEGLGQYYDAILKIKDDFNGVRVIIPENWVTYAKKTDDYTITPVKVNDNNIIKTVFVGDNNVKFGDIIDFVQEVILKNVENEAKKHLFRVKTAELANLFDTNNLSKLETMVFSFGKRKSKKKIEIDKSNIVLDCKNNEVDVIENNADVDDAVDMINKAIEEVNNSK